MPFLGEMGKPWQGCWVSGMPRPFAWCVTEKQMRTTQTLKGIGMILQCI
jgi:hypothetical protein